MSIWVSFYIHIPSRSFTSLFAIRPDLSLIRIASGFMDVKGNIQTNLADYKALIECHLKMAHFDRDLKVMIY